MFTFDPRDENRRAMPDHLTNKLKRELRQLNGLAWKRELDAELRQLDQSFDLWKDGGIDAFGLSDRIHQFHDGGNRELFKYYASADGSFTVSSAIARGIIDRTEVSAELLDALDDSIRQIQDNLDRQTESGD